MNKELSPYFNRLENSRLDLLNKLEDKPDSILNKEPMPGKWSALQVLYHVKEAEKLSLQYMKKKVMDTSSLRSSAFKDQLRTYLLKILLSLPLKFEAPRVVKENIPDSLSLEEVKDEWDEVREEMRVFLEKLDRELFNKRIFKHPRIGMINIKQTLDFYQSHFDHHVPQVMRTLN